MSKLKKTELSLIEFNPTVMQEWDYEKNIVLPEAFRPISRDKVWWKCNKGHSWQAAVFSRVKNGCGCPYCSGRLAVPGVNDLATLRPDLLKTWDYELNTIDPTTVSPGSEKEAHWVCEKGHKWTTKIYSRGTCNSGCPCCFGRLVIEGENDLATLRPDLASEWDYKKNGKLLPTQVKAFSSRKVYWKCAYGHEWKAVISSRSHGCNCPTCGNTGTSRYEQGIAFYLEQITEVQQRVKLFGKEIDVYLPKYNAGVEYNGIFHKSNAFAGTRCKDQEKDKVLTENGVFMLYIIDDENCQSDDRHFYYKEKTLDSNFDNALKQVCNALYNKTGDSVFLNLDINSQRDSIQIRERSNLNKKANSMLTTNPEVAKEWDYKKNGILHPVMFTAHSKEKIWWKCPEGHSYNSIIANRCIHHSGCPYCANKKLLKGFNDLASRFPEVVKELDAEANGFSADSIVFSSHKICHWKCSLGHTWTAPAYRRTGKGAGHGCPVCSHNATGVGYNDLLSQRPDIAAGWDYERNKGLSNKMGRDISTPDKISYKSNLSVWWRCPEGHSWQAPVFSRTKERASGICPCCKSLNRAA